MHTIVTDNQITRNRRVHHVISPEDMVVFTSPLLKDCIEYLSENNVQEFYIDYGEYRAKMHLREFSHGHEVTLMGWLHRTPDEEAVVSGNAQAATHIATL